MVAKAQAETRMIYLFLHLLCITPPIPRLLFIVRIIEMFTFLISNLFRLLFGREGITGRKEYTLNYMDDAIVEHIVGFNDVGIIERNARI